MLFDSHAHLNNADMTEEDRAQMVAQIEASIAKNTPAAAGTRSGDFYQTNYYQSPKALSPYEAARQTKIATQNMILKLQKG